METRDIKIFSLYKSARNAVCREIRKINREQQQEVAAQCKENPKKNFGNSLIINVTTDLELGIGLQRIHVVIILQSHPTMIKQMSWAIIFHRYLPKKQKT